MILVLGASGYMGRAFFAGLTARDAEFKAVSRRDVDYTSFTELVGLLRDSKASFLINAAGFTGKPNVDACEVARAETLEGNVLLPQTISHACEVAKVPWGHISSGCIYDGAWIEGGDGRRLEKDLTAPAVREVIDSHPETIRGFSEDDEPNFSFRNPPCSFYSGTKALAEEWLRQDPQAYIWRLRIPFDDEDDPRNYLTKMQKYAKLYENVNSISHRGEFVMACMDLWEKRAPFGIYNVTNPGFVTTRQVVDRIRKILLPDKQFEFFTDDKEFYSKGVTAPRSNCVMDVSKLQSVDIQLRPAIEAVDHALTNWKAAS